MSVPGIVNVQDYGVLTTNSAATNTANLQSLVSKMLSSDGPTGGHGGTIQFPSSGTYPFDGTITIGPDDELPPVTQSYSILFVGTGAQSLSLPLLQMTDGSGDLFVVNNGTTSDETVGGVLFRDLSIQYATNSTPGAAIRALNTQNVRIERVIFQDAGVVFVNVLQGLVRACTFIYEEQTVGTAIAMTDNGTHSSECNQMLIEKCDIRTASEISSNSLIGVSITGCKHATVRTVSISGLNQGILLTPTTELQNNMEFAHIDDVQVGTFSAALVLQPLSGTGSKLNDTRVTNSSFQQSSGGTYTGGGIFVDTNGGLNAQVDTVRLIGCTSQGWLGPGLQINGGQNIQVIGGKYSGNGQGSGTVSAGIAITGSTAPPAYISVVGADLSATYLNSSAQLYALLVSASPSTQVVCKDCFIVGYSGNPIGVTGFPTNLQIVNCSGYNDRNATVAVSAPTSSESAAAEGYYGPSLATFSNAASLTVTLGTTAYTMTSGSISLLPYDTIKFSAAPSAFQWIGK